MLEDIVEKWRDVLDTADSDDYYTLNLVKEFLDDLESYSKSERR